MFFIFKRHGTKDIFQKNRLKYVLGISTILQVDQADSSDHIRIPFNRPVYLSFTLHTCLPVSSSPASTVLVVHMVSFCIIADFILIIVTDTIMIGICITGSRSCTVTCIVMMVRTYRAVYTDPIVPAG